MGCEPQRKAISVRVGLAWLEVGNVAALATNRFSTHERGSRGRRRWCAHRCPCEPCRCDDRHRHRSASSPSRPHRSSNRNADPAVGKSAQAARGRDGPYRRRQPCSASRPADAACPVHPGSRPASRGSQRWAAALRENPDCTDWHAIDDDRREICAQPVSDLAAYARRRPQPQTVRPAYCARAANQRWRAVSRRRAGACVFVGDQRLPRNRATRERRCGAPDR